MLKNADVRSCVPGNDEADEPVDGSSRGMDHDGARRLVAENSRRIRPWLVTRRLPALVVVTCLIGAGVGLAVHFSRRPLPRPRAASGAQVTPILPFAAPSNTPAFPPANLASTADNTGSVVQVMATACNMVTSGSGFFVGPNLIVTDAHVVAGDPAPNVINGDGTFTTQPVLFDPDLDIAVLRVTSLTRPALSLAGATVAPETAAVVVGYPYGGAVSEDHVTVSFPAVAHMSNIYGAGAAVRDIYVVHGAVQPGDSGSPVRSKDGQVLGVIFAAAPNDPTTAYALSSSAVSARIQPVMGAAAAVGDGPCVTGDAPFAMEITGAPS